jgi:hypothetical protein
MLFHLDTGDFFKFFDQGFGGIRRRMKIDDQANSGAFVGSCSFLGTPGSGGSATAQKHHNPKCDHDYNARLLLDLLLCHNGA